MKIGDILLEGRALSLGYGQTPVLERIDFTVRAGEFWFIVGPNGSGKSTLLKALIGVLTPEHGEIRLDPIVLDRAQLGFVPQSCRFNPSLPTTIREFVLLGLVGIKTDRKEAAERLVWALDAVDLQGMERRDYWSLSDGERQRALVARALVRYPSLLIMDEPTGGLDMAVETKLMEYLGRLNQEEGITIVCVSHDLETAVRYGTRVGLVSQRGIQTGRPLEVLTPDNLKRVYGLSLDLANGDNRLSAQVLGSIS
jgi:ABC-type Mn2+/Zn2+ transport system ATPase subunit